MLKKILKVFLGLIGGLVLLVGALVLTLFLTLRANLPETYFELAGSPPAIDAPPVLIVGAKRGTGLEIARRLHERGETIVAMVRPGSDEASLAALKELDAEFITGDAMNAEAVNAALASRPFRAVISSIGCLSCDPPPDGVGNINIAKAAQAAGVQRMILISSIGVGDSADAAPFMSKLFLAKILPEKDKSETYLRESGLDYTIIRPGGLPENAPMTGRGEISDDISVFGFIGRPDLGAVTVAVLDDPRTIGKTFAAVDPGIESAF